VIKRFQYNSKCALNFIFGASPVIDRDGLAPASFSGLFQKISGKERSAIISKKKNYFLCSMLVITGLLCAQTPTYFNSASPGGTNSFPFNNFNNSRQVSWFFPTGNFGTLPSSLLITDVLP